jgi:hypothetical protein
MKNFTQKEKSTIAVVVGIAFLLVAGYYFWNGLVPNVSNKLGEYYVNARGQEWQLPTDGEYRFTASSGEYPKFTGGVVSPLKVRVGDTQLMQVRIASPVALKSVKAVIDTDSKTQEIPLTMKESKALSADYFRSQPYLVSDEGTLIINKGNGYAESVLNQLVSKAEAQALMEYSYEGAWVVNDTHTKTYHTKFVAEDINGDTATLTLAWSDPECVFDANGNLQGSCSPTTGVEGFDGGDLLLGDNTVNLTGNSTLVWNGDADHNASLRISSGAITLQTGSTAKIKEALLWYNDVDGDTFTDDLGTMHYECLDQCTPEVRVKDSPSRPWNPNIGELPNGGLDCHDDNANAFPGQTSYFINAIVDKDFDYNCDRTTEGGWASYDAGNGQTQTTEVFGVAEGGVGSEFLPSYTCTSGAIFDANNSCSHVAYSVPTCDPRSISGGVGVPDEVPSGVTNGWTALGCTICLGTDIAGYCR